MTLLEKVSFWPSMMSQGVRRFNLGKEASDTFSYFYRDIPASTHRIVAVNLLLLADDADSPAPQIRPQESNRRQQSSNTQNIVCIVTRYSLQTTLLEPRKSQQDRRDPLQLFVQSKHFKVFLTFKPISRPWPFAYHNTQDHLLIQKQWTGDKRMWRSYTSPSVWVLPSMSNINCWVWQEHPRTLKCFVFHGIMD